MCGTVSILLIFIFFGGGGEGSQVASFIRNCATKWNALVKNLLLSCPKHRDIGGCHEDFKFSGKYNN